MKEFILVDTDILIDAGRGVSAAMNCLSQKRKMAFLAVSVITKMELIVGCENGNELRNTFKFLTHFDVVHIDKIISQAGADLLEKYQLSHGLLIPDAFIAATAISQNTPLLSKNQRDYRFISDLDLLAYP